MVFSRIQGLLLDNYRQARRLLSPSEEYRLHVRKDGLIVKIPSAVSFISPANW